MCIESNRTHLRSYLDGVHYWVRLLVAVPAHHGHGVVTAVRVGWVLRLAEQDSGMRVFYFAFACTLAEKSASTRVNVPPRPEGVIAAQLGAHQRE